MTAQLLTPNIGTAAMEDRDRIDHVSLRADRRARVFATMDALDLDALMLGREPNVRYASGARRLWTASSRPYGPTAVAVRATGRIHLMTFSASYEGAPEEIPFEDVYCNSFNPGKLLEALLAIPGLAAARRVGVDGFSVFMRDFLPNAVPDASFIGVGPQLEALRRTKLPGELAAMRTAVAIAESSLYAAARSIEPGTSEKALQAAYMARMCELGTSQFAQQGTFSVVDRGEFRFITGNRVVEAGSSVVLAGGALWAGYEGSLARTWTCGAPSAGARAVRQRAERVIDAITDVCRPGRTGADLAGAYRATGETLPPYPIASAIGLGHEGSIANTSLGADFDRETVLAVDQVVAIRAHVRDGDHCHYAEEMILVRAAGPERLTTLGTP